MTENKLILKLKKYIKKYKNVRNFSEISGVGIFWHFCFRGTKQSRIKKSDIFTHGQSAEALKMILIMNL